MKYLISVLITLMTCVVFGGSTMIPDTTTKISSNASYTVLSGLTAIQIPSTNYLTVDAMAYNQVIMILTNDIEIQAPTNAIDGRKLQWRFTATNGNWQVSWPTNKFIIPSSSTMTNCVIVSNNTSSIFLTEFNQYQTNWFMETYVWGY